MVSMTTRAMLGDAARLPEWSHHARNASSPATEGAMMPSMSKPCSTASGSTPAVVYGSASTSSLPIG